MLLNCIVAIVAIALFIAGWVFMWRATRDPHGQKVERYMLTALGLEILALGLSLAFDLETLFEGWIAAWL